MNAGIRRVGILCGVLVFAGAAALVLSGELAPARPEGGVPMVERKACPAGDGAVGPLALTADKSGKFSQSTEAPVGDGAIGRASVLVSEPMLDAANKRPVRSVAIIGSIMKDARLLQSAHELQSMSAERSEPIRFSASAYSPSEEGGDSDYSYELLIQPRDGLTWGQSRQFGDLVIEIVSCTD